MTPEEYKSKYGKKPNKHAKRLRKRMSAEDFKDAMLVAPHDKGANDLNQKCIDVMSLRGWFCWRQNNTAVYDPKIKQFRKFSGLRGVSDILGYRLRDGKLGVIETKINDKLSVEQTAFLEGVKVAGGFAAVVRSISGLIAQLDEFEKGETE